MYKFCHLRWCVFFVVSLLFGGVHTAWAEYRWIKINASDLSSGDVVAIVDLTSSRAMSNNNGSSNVPTAISVKLSADQSEITGTVRETIQWVVNKYSDGNLQFKISGTSNYLYCLDKNDGLRVGTNTNHQFVIADGFLKETKTKRFLGVYYGTSWKAYSTIDGDIASTVTAFYKRFSVPVITVSDQTLACGETYTPSVTGGDVTITAVPNIITVENGVLTATAVGTATVTVSTTANQLYAAGEESFALTVTAPMAYNEKPLDAPGTVSVTVPAGRFATYCCLYPLNLDELDTDVKAYKVGVVTAEEAKLQRLKGTVRGGVPFILYGEPGDYTLTLASSSAVVPDGNQLVGTLAPTFVCQTEGDNTHFGLSAANGDFRKIKDAGMIVPSNKAYLPIPTRLLTDEARFVIVFEEMDSPSMVQDVTVCNDTDMSVYNLNGQRVSHPCKGLFVKNGRKVHIR